MVIRKETQNKENVLIIVNRMRTGGKYDRRQRQGSRWKDQTKNTQL